ncbi:MAG: hypothetical protein ACREP7_12790, partial [Lysobacter sp.]
MSGPNEHHIPQFLQRPFAIERKGGQPNQIWFYTRDAVPEPRAISDTASEDHFYGSDLDAKLKVPENELGRHFATLRKQAVGTTVDPALAADLVGHLAPRSKHVRMAMAAGLHRLVLGAHSLFADPDNLSALLGLDTPAPSDQFHKHIAEAIEDNAQLRALGLPLPILERVAFYVAKERFDINAGSTASLFDSILSRWSAEAPTMARDGHNRALESLSEGKNPRRDHLAGFSWSVEVAPADGAILPDCVALGYPADEAPLPMIFADKEVQSVVMPISSGKLLVGREADSHSPDLMSFNRDAAACCEEFFLAHIDIAPFRSLAGTIGTRTAGYFEETVRTAVNETLPSRKDEEEESHGITAVVQPTPWT